MTMTTAEIVAEAFKAINAIDINEASASPAETAVATNRYTRMVAGWEAQGLNVGTVTKACVVTSGSAEITFQSATPPITTERLAPGLNVSGTGIAALTRILSVDSATKLTLDAAATASGSVTLTFTALPLQEKFEPAIIALLAQRLAVSPEDVPAWVNEEARVGWQALCANFMLVLPATLDTMLTNMTQTNQLSGVVLDNG